MNWRYITCLVLVVGCCWPLAGLAQLQLLPDVQPQRVFAGPARTIAITWHNPKDKTVALAIHSRIIQTSSATAVLIGERSWKKLEMISGQTVLESARLDFPAVKSETKFFIQWLDDSNNNLGKTEVLVYPTNLLTELKPLAGDVPVGVLDPLNQLKPLLKNLKVRFINLQNIDLEDFSARLAIIGPFESKTQMRNGLKKQIQELAKNGTAVVWLEPPTEQRSPFQPSFYSVSISTNAVVVVQPELVSDLVENPQSQLNLIYLCKLALHPQQLALPDVSPP